MGFCSDHTSGVGIVPVLPNASRAACATAETGFHSANVWRGPGRSPARTKVFATKVNGKMNMNDVLLTISTLDTFNPTHAMIHENA